MIPPFVLEEFWKKYEFTAPYLLCCSDIESWTLQEIVALADQEAKQLWESLSLGYTQSPGFPLLREEIARLYTSLQRDQILTFAGAEEGIYCAMRTLIIPGCHVVVIEPCYQSLSTLPRFLGADVTSVQLDPARGWRLDLEEVRKAMRSDTRLLVLNYPHNPTGALLRREEMEGLIALARESGAFIFCDEVYRYLEIDEKERLPSIADAYEKGISLHVMTKAFGLAGLRIGWIATQNGALLAQIGSYKLYTSICNSAPSEVLALIALRAKEHILRRNRELMLRNLEELRSFMARHRGVLAWTEPKGGTMAAIELLLPLSVEQLTADLVEKAGVLIIPASVLGLSGNFFRIGFGRKNFSEVLAMFEGFLVKI